MHPSSDLAKFFPNLVQGNPQINARPPPQIIPSIPPSSPHHPHMYPPPQIPYPHPGQPNDILPGSPHTPYYSNMYLARQNSQKLPYPPVASPPPPGMYDPQIPPYGSPVPPYHSPIPSHIPLPVSPVPSHIPLPPSPAPVPSVSYPTTPSSAASPHPDSKSKQPKKEKYV